jgi:hypothetical protein
MFSFEFRRKAAEVCCTRENRFKILFLGIAIRIFEWLYFTWKCPHTGLSGHQGIQLDETNRVQQEGGRTPKEKSRLVISSSFAWVCQQKKDIDSRTLS